MISFSKELNEFGQSLKKISVEFESLDDGNLTKVEEKKLMNLENSINLIHLRILNKQFDFFNYWKPSFERHEEGKKCRKFIDLTAKSLNDILLPLSEDLKSMIQIRSQWIRTTEKFRMEDSLWLMTLIFGLVAFLDSIVAYYQVVDNSVENLVLFTVPFILFVLITLVFVLIIKHYWLDNRGSKIIGNNLKNSMKKENKLMWELIFILFSVSLGFSVINANHAGILVPGDLLYFLLGSKTVIVTKVYSSLLFVALIFVNLFLIAICWKREWVKKINNFYLSFFSSFFIGISPMYFYYFGFLFAKYLLNMSGL